MKRLIRSTLVRKVSHLVEEGETECSQEAVEVEVKQEEEVLASPKRRCLESEVAVRSVKAPTLVIIQEEERRKKGKGGDLKGEEGKPDMRRKGKIMVKGIDDMTVEELKREMKRRKMSGYSRLNLEELRKKLKKEVNSQRVISVGASKPRVRQRVGGGEDTLVKSETGEGGGGAVSVAVAVKSRNSETEVRLAGVEVGAERLSLIHI